MERVGPYRFLRLMAIGVRTHVLYMSRSPLQLGEAVVTPVVFATLAFYLFRAGGQGDQLLQASVGAGLMGTWSSVLSGSGAAVQNQRWLGTMETLVAAPTPLVLTLLPITVSTALVGSYSMAATLLWGVVLFGVPLTFADPLIFVVALLVCLLALGVVGLLLASTFVFLRNANALANSLTYPIAMLSGMLVPISVLPEWTRPISWVLPTEWGTRAVTTAAGGGEVILPMVMAAVLGAVYVILALLALAHVQDRARRAATLSLV